KTSELQYTYPTLTESNASISLERPGINCTEGEGNEKSIKKGEHEVLDYVIRYKA
ncbi:unnamed protein product, partial [Dovyalis caffra]